MKAMVNWNALSEKRKHNSFGTMAIVYIGPRNE